MSRDRLLLLAAVALAGAGAFWYALDRARAGGLDVARARAGLLELPDLEIELGGLEDLAGDIVNAVTSGAWAPPDRAAPYLDMIAAAEDAHGIPRNLLARVLYQESRFREDIISGATRSSVGALGIAQFMPATAAELGVDPLDPASAIPGAAQYLAQLYRRFGNWREALAAYNWGQGNQERRDRADGVIGNDWPAETRAYVDQILGDVNA